MKNENKNKIKEKRETPVSDGDTRPDQQPNGQWPVSNEFKSETTKERDADVNSLEDYKDSNTTGNRSKRTRNSGTSAVPYQHDEENE